MRMISIFLSIVTAVGSTACTTEDPAATGEPGTLQFPLVQTGSDGFLYRLSGQFVVAGATGSQTVDATGADAQVSAMVEPGTYQISLSDGWMLERSTDGAVFAPIAAVVGSPNPARLTVESNATASVQFRFLVGAGDPTSTVMISFGVDMRGGKLIGTLHPDFASGPFSPYAMTAPTFATWYEIGSESTGLGPPNTHTLTAGPCGTVFDHDDVGLLTTIGRTMSGGFFQIHLEANPDGTQAFVVVLVATNAVTPGADRPLLQMFTAMLEPRLPVDPVFGAPVDPLAVQLQATVPFMLQGQVGNDTGTLSGTADLQFVP